MEKELEMDSSSLPEEAATACHQMYNSSAKHEVWGVEFCQLPLTPPARAPTRTDTRRSVFCPPSLQ